MYIVIVFNLKQKGCLVRMFGGEISRGHGTIMKDTCLTIYIVLSGCYLILESRGGDNKLVKSSEREQEIYLSLFKAGEVILRWRVLNENMPQKRF